ncbi:transposase [Gluconobacter sphaericus]|uniref:transposase n=1 Tax=Gluconobacter sphaericus TaxID=574987 RepID=UPI0038D0B052
MSNSVKKFSPEVRSRAVRLVLEYEDEHPSRWTAMVSIAGKIGCSAHTLNEWVKKAEVETSKRTGVPAETADRLKALEREVRQAELDRVNRQSCPPLGSRVSICRHSLHRVPGRSRD